MKLRRIKVYWNVWQTIAKYAFAETFLNRWSNLFFLLGKSVRFGMLLFFLLLLQQNIHQIAGYTSNQIMIFFLIYQFLDTGAQIFYRGVYTFSNKVRSGEFDFYLSKPLHPLFRVLMGQPDIMDVFFFIPSTLISIWLLGHVFQSISLPTALLFILLICNSFLLITSLHIFVLCLGVLTTEVDNAIMLYRDFNTLGRFPINIYREPLRTFLFFAVPIGFINTIPAQVITGIEPSYAVILSFGIGISFLLLSLRLWTWSIKRYTSAGG
jgi:ABC-2 type transport system permease protein